MPLKPKKGGSGRIPCPAGLWPSIIIDVYGLKKMKRGKYKPVDQLCIVVELDHKSAGTAKREGDSGVPEEWPYHSYPRETLSMDKKSNLRPMIETFEGVPFGKQEDADDYPFDDMIGRQCQVQIQHRPKDDGDGVWDNVTAMLPPSPGQNVTLFEEYIPMRKRAKEEMPEWIQDKIFFDVDDEGKIINPFTGLAERALGAVEEDDDDCPI